MISFDCPICCESIKLEHNIQSAEMLCPFCEEKIAVPKPKASQMMLAKPKEEIKAAQPIIGIDLGTTYSVVAWMNKQDQVEIIPNKEGFLTTPSVVYIDANNVLIGKEALKTALLEPEKSANMFKRDMGNKYYRKQVGGKSLRPEYLSALLLKMFKQDAEGKLGEIKEAVITVPAYFNDKRRKATQDAALLAGFESVAIINEPTAAAIYYGFIKNEYRKESLILVYDLGGGTFDVTLMKVKDKLTYETIATDGDVMLGGKDWDKKMFDYVAEQFLEQTQNDFREDPICTEEIMQSIENAKQSLSRLSSVNVLVSYNGHRIKIPVTREQFEEMTSDLLLRTRTTVELLIDEAGVTWDSIDKLIITGGSSRMPMVSEMLEHLSGKKLGKDLDCDTAVAQGAALYGASIFAKKNDAGNKSLIDLSHKNVNSHSLGVEIENADGMPENFKLISKNTHIPVKKSMSFGTTSEILSSADEILVKILEGESKNPRACTEVGVCSISNLPLGLKEGTLVDVSFIYSKDGRIYASAVVKELDLKVMTTIQSGDSFTEDEFNELKSNISGLTIE